MKGQRENDQPGIDIDLQEISEIIELIISWPLVALILTAIFANPLRKLILRAASAESGKFKVGNFEAGYGRLGDEDEAEIEELEVTSDVENESLPEPETDKEPKNESWYAQVDESFSRGEIEEADHAFDSYAETVNDEEQLASDKAFYLYRKFEKGKVDAAIDELENNAKNEQTENARATALLWLSFALTDSMQYQREINACEAVLAKADSTRHRIVSMLSKALVKAQKVTDAKRLVIEELKAAVNDQQKTTLYAALSSVESALGNNELSIYCKDKSLEFDVSNRDELFNSAYAASKGNIDFLAISTYRRLLRIDTTNSMALNNLGVQAQEFELETKAVELFNRAADYKNSLAMANLGYRLIGAGFDKKALAIAERGLEQKNPHDNLHSLMTKIKDKKSKQNDEWEEIGTKSLNKQNEIREYTKQYYLGNTKDLEGEWLVNDSTPVNLSVENGKFELIWMETQGIALPTNYSVSLVGTVAGSTLAGTYTRKEEGKTASILASGNASYTCIGFVSREKGRLEIKTKSIKDDFNMFLYRSSELKVSEPN